jgi:hypothetical protein
VCYGEDVGQCFDDKASPTRHVDGEGQRTAGAATHTIEKAITVAGGALVTCCN